LAWEYAAEHPRSELPSYAERPGRRERLQLERAALQERQQLEVAVSLTDP